MNALSLGGKSILWLRLLLPLSAFTFGFFISYQQDRIRVSEVAQMAWLHWSYASDLKDDMAVIDWSKNMEGMDNILAFQASMGPKIVVEGGNQNYLPAHPEDGVSLETSGRWVTLRSTQKDPLHSRKLILVYHSFPSPLFWGFFGLAVSLLSLWLGWVRSKGCPSPQNNPVKRLSHEASSRPAAPPVFPSDPSAIEKNRPLMFIDKHFLIQQVTPEAALLLQKTSSDLLGRHLFDLKPAPRLMQALDGNEEVKLLNPFLSNPLISVILKPDRNGTLMFLERVEETKAP